MKKSSFFSLLTVQYSPEGLQTKVKWKIDGDVLHYIVLLRHWFLSFILLNGKKKTEFFSCVIQNISNESSPAVHKYTIINVVFEFL